MQWQIQHKNDGYQSKLKSKQLFFSHPHKLLYSGLKTTVYVLRTEKITQNHRKQTITLQRNVETRISFFFFLVSRNHIYRK